MNIKIEKFLKRHNVMSLATVDEQGLWCASVFYVYTDNRVIFFSSPATRHIVAAKQNPNVAVSIALESKVVARLQGAQITGRFIGQGNEKYRPLFLKKFPIAALWKEEIWSIEIDTVKYTDNTLGFGTKLYFPSVTDSDSI